MLHFCRTSEWRTAGFTVGIGVFNTNQWLWRWNIICRDSDHLDPKFKLFQLIQWLEYAQRATQIYSILSNLIDPKGLQILSHREEMYKLVQIIKQACIYAKLHINCERSIFCPKLLCSEAYKNLFSCFSIDNSQYKW